MSSSSVRGAGPGGGAGGAITVADGADVTQGSKADVAWVSGDGTTISLLKKIAASSGGGTSMVDDAAFTAGTTGITPAGAFFNDSTPDSVNEGDGGAVRMSANRNLYSTIRDAAGNERGLNVDTNGAIAATVTGTVTATGALTDTELRATPVPVSGTVTASGPLTDTELRATPVPVSGTVSANATLDAETTKVIGTVNIAAAQTIAATNAGTFATQATLQAGTAEIGKLAAGVAEIGNVKNSGTFATQATLQAGTAEFGKLAAGVAEIGNVKNSGTFAVQPSAATSIGSFKKVVTTATTRVQLDTNTSTSCTIKAEASNTGIIYVGDVTVAAANGFELAAGESLSLDITNTNLVYIDASVSTDGVSVVYVA